MPEATIIIPVAPHHLHLAGRAVRSARAQTIPCDVLVYIDYAQAGPARGRNIMASQVRTPFVVQLDADDYLHPRFIERTLKNWEPGSYVYTDWKQGDEHHKAIWCYPFKPADDERDFHLPPTLFPTAFWRMVGGQDETLFGAEDTDFFWKCNAKGIRSLALREPLFTYTADGKRSKEAGSRPEWRALLTSIFDRYKEDFSMACCGQPGDKSPVGNENPGDWILVRMKSAAATLVRGDQTGRVYGRYSNSRAFYINPKDFNERTMGRATDWEAASPTKAEIRAAAAIPPAQPTADELAVLKAESESFPVTQRVGENRPASAVGSVDWGNVKAVKAAIIAAGVRDWSTGTAHGFDIQQDPEELAALIVRAHQAGVTRVLEIGTGESAGFARFMVEVLGWQVVSVDVTRPTTSLHGHANWTFIEGDSSTVQHDALTAMYDLVFIDGDHTAEAAQADWNRFADLGTLVAVHDIHPDGHWGADEYVGGFWRKQSRTAKQNLKKGFSEIINPAAKQGVGVYES